LPDDIKNRGTKTENMRVIFFDKGSEGI
jgi:hypothetical protein